MDYSTPDTRTDEISLRADVLGIRGACNDDVTGESLDEGEQFRRRLFRASNLNEDGATALKFSTSVNPNNGVWSTGLCNDQIALIDVKIVGDGLGDSQATVVLSQAGTAVQRSCDAFRGGAGDELHPYDMANAARAEI